MKKIFEQTLKIIVMNPFQNKLISSMIDNADVEKIVVRKQMDVIQIEAEVCVFKKHHACAIQIDDMGNIMQATCDCPWSREGMACTHIKAVVGVLSDLEIDKESFDYVNPKAQEKLQNLQSLQEEIEQWNLEEEASESRRLIQKARQQYMRKIAGTLQDEEYEIEPQMEDIHSGYPRITFRVGRDKFYIIKDIEEFVERIDAQEEYSYGKSLTFIHKEDAFSFDSQEQIKMLRKCIAQKRQEKDRFGYYNNVNIGRYLTLNEEILDVFFETYTGKSVGNFTCVDCEERLRVHVEETKYTYLYHWAADDTLYRGKKHLYKFEDISNTLLRYPMDEQGKAIAFLESCNQKKLPVLKSEYNDFYKYVLSDLQEFLEVDEVESQETSYEIIRLYGDIDEQEQMYITLDYYNESGGKRKGFDEHNTTSFQQDLVEEMVKKYAQTIDYDKHIAYFDMEGELAYRFICDALPTLHQYCEIFVSDALKKLGSSQQYSITIGVRFQNDLLSIDIDSNEIAKDELANVLKSYRRKKKFYRLKNGELLNLNSQNIEELDQFMDDYHLSINQLGQSVQLPSYRMLSLDEADQVHQHLQFERDQMFQDKIMNWKQSDEIVKELPSSYETVLRGYQKDGVHWMQVLKEYGFHGILADDMGLGKTLQVICLLETNLGQGCSVVVCPASLIYNWEDEVHKFSKVLNVLCICGDQKERQKRLEKSANYHLIITSYDYLRRDIEYYEELNFYYAILDEAQNIKNQKTKNALSVKRLKASHRLALSGTPIENSLAELWSLFDFLMPNYLYNYHYFQKQYENDIVKNHDEEKQKKLKRLVSPFILRRNKQEVLKELPDKIERNYLIDFNEEERNLYYAHLAKVNTELQRMAMMENTDKIAILAMLTRLRQLCCEPRLLFENIDHASSKLMACMDLIESMYENNQKVLLFSSFTSMLDLIAVELTLKGISYYMLTGQTSKEERRSLVNKFQKDDTIVFLISLKAGGTGLNLTAAQAVIHYDPWWNQSAQNQATDRAYRIGQEKNVQVYKLVMKNSIEEKILKLQLKKKELADLFVEENDGSISKMSRDDLIELFKL